MKKRDLILIGAILASALMIFAIVCLAAEDGAYVVVRVDGEEVARYDLAQDGEYLLLDGKNVLRIEGGKAYLTHADCPDRLCVRRGKISKSGETITCLPHKLTVTVYSSDGDVELVAE